MGDVYDVQQQVCLACLVEGRFEGIDKVCGQFSDESYGISEQEGKVFYHHLADGGVEGGEQLVLGKHLALGQHIHDGALTDVGISHECHADESAPVLALRRLLLVYLRQTFFQQRHAVQDDASVHLQLCLTRSAQSHGTLSAAAARAAALSLKVRPQPLQTGQHVAILRQLHLRLGIRRLGTHGEDVEDEARAVENLYFQFVFDVTDLLGAQLVVEYHHSDRLRAVALLWVVQLLLPFVVGLLLRLDVFAYLLQLSRTHIRHTRRAVHPLRETLYGNGTGSVGQKFQLVEIFLRLRFVLLRRNESHQHSRFRLRFRYDKFLHASCLVNTACKVTNKIRKPKRKRKIFDTKSSKMHKKTGRMLPSFRKYSLKSLTFNRYLNNSSRYL